MSLKLTQEEIEDMVEAVDFIHMGTLTICVLELINGAQVVGKSNVIDPANYDAEIGCTMAEKDAIGKIWELEGYAVKTRGSKTIH